MNRNLDSLRTYLERDGAHPSWIPAPGVVVVGAGKGGVGSSTVSLLLALAGSREGRRVLLVDADESVGSLHFLLGMEDPGPGLGDLRGGELAASDLLHSLSETLWFLPGGGGGPEATLATSLGERRALYRRVAGLYPEFDLVVLDGGSHLGSVVASCSAGVERLLAVTSRERVAMAACHALLKVSTARFPRLPVEILVNHSEGPAAEDVFRMMFQASLRFLGARPAFAGAIPEDPALRARSDEGLSLLTLPTSSPALESAGILQGRLATEQESARGDHDPALLVSFPS